LWLIAGDFLQAINYSEAQGSIISWIDLDSPSFKSAAAPSG
jgi:hypothetical protein